MSEHERRRFFADALSAHFRAHPWEWVSIMTLIRIGGPSWRSRLVEDLRQHRKMEIPWNGDSRQSAYMYRPTGPALGRDASSIVVLEPGQGRLI